MINKLGQVMLYVANQEESLKFWTEKAGFQVVADETSGPMRWIEIVPAADAATSLVLHNKELIAKMQPELNLSTPSLLFYSNDLDRLYQDFKDKGVTVGDLVSMPSRRVFNFADNEGNYFAVAEK
ncbi:VOC family protein [Tumebacillus flagellatus]|uniref:Glyoxalase n=1 Tax=Tumebacillus flagellatus TaxID=1157490 RepID=A0A074LJR6_9BACL|nr:VOC family protein [Tumebacillus flagellatus]KEO82411.1 glyoxalase [Tumebacillus flagellatus]